MKKTAMVIFAFLIAIAVVARISMADKPKVGPDCTYKGKKLYGKIMFVEAFPDLKVQSVDAFPDLKVKFVDAFPDHCGEWKVVEAFPDLKVQWVEAFPDVKIKFVEAFPGLP